MSTIPSDVEIEARRRCPQRLAVVARAHIVDTPDEGFFDEMARLAARATDSLAGFITILLGERDFYKSVQSQAGDLGGSRHSTGRTYCHFALCSSGPLLIEDTLKVPEYAAVPSVKDPGIRAYMGVPIRLQGQPVGSFCVADVRPHAWSNTDVELLCLLVRSVERELASRSSGQSSVGRVGEARKRAQAYLRSMSLVGGEGEPVGIMRGWADLVAAGTGPITPADKERLLRALRIMDGLLESPMPWGSGGQVLS